MSIIPVSVPAKVLAQTISSTATSFKLNNILAWNGVDLTPADFGTEAFAVLTNSARSVIEIIKFDPATIADASISILTRGLDYSGGLVPALNRQYAWTGNDTIVQLGTDAPQLFREFLSQSNPATVTALFTFNVLPESAVVPTTGDQFTNKDYVDGLTQPAITVPINQVGHAFVVGDVIRISGIDTYTKAQADAPANAEVVGIVVEVVDADNFKYITEGITTAGVGIHTAGTVLFLSPTTAGLLTATEPSTIGQVSIPLAVVTQSSVRMIFHKYRGAQINTIAGNPIASETIAGIVEEATQAQADAKTATGETLAKLFVPPNKMRATKFNDYVLDTGSADVYEITPSPAITAYAAGQVFVFKVANANTGSSTLNVNGLGVQSIKKKTTENLEVGDFLAGQMVVVAYDGTNFQAVGLGAADPVYTYPVIQAVQAFDHTGATVVNVTMPAGIVAGELLLSFCYNDGNITVQPAGWTLVSQADVKVYVWAKIATGGDTLSYTLSSTTSETAHLTYRINNLYNSPFIADIIKGTPTLGAISSQTDPPPINPDNVLANYLFFVANGHTGTGDIATSPAGYSSPRDRAFQAGDAYIYTANRTAVVVFEDPGAWSGFSGTTTNRQTATIAIRGPLPS